MKITLSTLEAAEILHQDQNYRCWSAAGALALVEYLEQLEESCRPREEFELDPIALRCDFTEYETILDAEKEYGEDFGQFPERKQAALDYFRDQTDVIEFEGGVILRNF